MKVVINDCFGGFSLSHRACLWLHEHGVPNMGEFIDGEFDSTGGRRIDRHHPLLIECVELFGAIANGAYAELKIVEIPDGVDYVIEVYDGNEHVAEKHRTWG